MPIPLQPTYLPKTHRLLHVKRETEMVRTFTMDCSLGARPGQFVMVWLPGVDEVPMSVAYDDGKTTKLTFFAVGDMTTELAKCEPGALIGLRGPFGTHYEWMKKQKLVLVAGGYGAAPMYFAAKEALKDDCMIDMIIGARSKEHLLYVKEFEGLKGVTLHVSTDDGSQGFKGYNVQLLEQLINGNVQMANGKSIDQVFACGPERMLKAVSDVTAKEKIPSQLSLERYMKCGYGICGNCTVDPLGIRLCVEGPVVKNETCVKITEFGRYHRDALGKKHAF